MPRALRGARGKGQWPWRGEREGVPWPGLGWKAALRPGRFALETRPASLRQALCARLREGEAHKSEEHLQSDAHPPGAGAKAPAA